MRGWANIKWLNIECNINLEGYPKAIHSLTSSEPDNFI